MKLKPDVKPQGLSVEILIAILAAQEVYREIGKEFVITSFLDGKHKRGSKHYIGNAFDMRTRHLNDPQKAVVVDKLKASLTGDYDLVLHSTHLHCEYDPKGD